MPDFIYFMFEILNIILIFAIFTTFSIIFYNTKNKYDVIASTLFLKRKTLKKTILTGYLGVMLSVAGNFIFILNMDIDGFLGMLVQIVKILGLYMILYMAFRIYTTINMSRQMNDILARTDNPVNQ